MRPVIVIATVFSFAAAACVTPPNLPQVVSVRGGATTLVGFTADRVVAATPSSLFLWDKTGKTPLPAPAFGGSLNPLSRIVSPLGVVAFNWVRSNPVGGPTFGTSLLAVPSGRITPLTPEAETSSVVLAVTADGSVLVRATSNVPARRLTLQWWRLPEGIPLDSAVVDAPENGSGAIALDRTGNYMAIGLHRRSRENPNPPHPVGRILVYDRARHRTVTDVPVEDIPRGMAFNEDASLLFAGSDLGGVIDSWEVSTGRLLPSGVPAHNGPVQYMASTSTARLVASASTRDTHVRVWRTTDRSVVLDVVAEAIPYSVALDRDGSRLAVGTQSGAIQIWAVPKRLAAAR